MRQIVRISNYPASSGSGPQTGSQPTSQKSRQRQLKQPAMQAAAQEVAQQPEQPAQQPGEQPAVQPGEAALAEKWERERQLNQSSLWQQRELQLWNQLCSQID